MIHLRISRFPELKMPSTNFQFFVFPDDNKSADEDKWDKEIQKELDEEEEKEKDQTGKYHFMVRLGK
jgi:hypothetical protein